MRKTIESLPTPPCLCDGCRQSLCDWLRAYERVQEAQARDGKGRNPFLAQALFHHIATHLRLIRRVLAAAKPEAIAKRGEAP